MFFNNSRFSFKPGSKPDPTVILLTTTVLIMVKIIIVYFKAYIFHSIHAQIGLHDDGCFIKGLSDN